MSGKQLHTLHKKIGNVWSFINHRSNIKELAQNPFVKWEMLENLYQRQKASGVIGRELIYQDEP